MLVLISILLLTNPFSAAFAEENNSAPLTRGEFIKALIDHLGVSPENTAIKLPKDVQEDSPYTPAVKVLKEKKILKGYPDGTFRLDQVITHQEASFIVGRLLNINDGQAVTYLKEEFGIDLATVPVLSKSQIGTVFNSALVSDPNAVELMSKVTKNYYEAESYEAIQSFTSEMQFNQNITQEYMKMTGEYQSKYDNTHGIFMQGTMHVSQKEMGENEVTIEQFISPNGGYVNMYNQTLDEEMHQTIPITEQEFKQMLEQEKQTSLELYTLLENKYMFYRDLGIEEIDGNKYRKIAYTGKVDSMLDLLNSLGGNQYASLQQQMAGSNTDLVFAISGVTYVNEETRLPFKEQITLNYTITAPEQDTTMLMDFNLDNQYVGFNHLTKKDFPELPEGKEEALEQQ